MPRARCVDSGLLRPDRRVRPLPGRRGPNHHCARVGASASTAPRPAHPEPHASGWIARAAGAWVLLCLHTTDTRPRRGGRRCHHRVPSCTPRRASSRIARRLPCHGSPSATALAAANYAAQGNAFGGLPPGPPRPLSNGPPRSKPSLRASPLHAVVLAHDPRHRARWRRRLATLSGNLKQTRPPFGGLNA